jgi:hypothetical protein
LDKSFQSSQQLELDPLGPLVLPGCLEDLRKFVQVQLVELEDWDPFWLVAIAVDQYPIHGSPHHF